MQEEYRNFPTRKFHLLLRSSELISSNFLAPHSKKMRRSSETMTNSHRMSFEPSEDCVGALVGREHRIEDVRDSSSANDQRNPFHQAHLIQLKCWQVQGIAYLNLAFAQVLNGHFRPRSIL